jgi:hypothetical protein
MVLGVVTGMRAIATLYQLPTFKTFWFVSSLREVPFFAVVSPYITIHCHTWSYIIVYHIHYHTSSRITMYYCVSSCIMYHRASPCVVICLHTSLYIICRHKLSYVVMYSLPSPCITIHLHTSSSFMILYTSPVFRLGVIRCDMVSYDGVMGVGEDLAVIDDV